jgi:2-methylcitrate dehydratase PrpD
MDETRRLAEWVLESRPQDIPGDVVHEAKRALVNIVGCMLGGAQEEAVDVTIDALGPFFGDPHAWVLGRHERTDVLHAALLNGIAAHVHDFDDTTPGNYCHTSAPVASALLARASTTPLSGPDLLHAFIVGFEATSRVANAVYPSHYDAGWHITGTAGVLGAAAASGRILGLDDEQMVWALGLAGTHAAGVREMFGSMGKALHPGRAAQHGLSCALLAQAGFTAGVHGIEGPRGFAAVLAAESDLSRITDGLGESFDLRVNAYKPFPCGIVNHPAIDACIGLHEEHGPAPQDIAGVRLHVAPLVLDLCNQQDITVGLQGKFSVYHGAAVGLVRGRAGLDEYTDEAVNDPDVRRVRELTTATAEDPTVTEDGVDVEVRLTSGAVLHRRLEHSLGNLARPMSDAQLDAKFRDQAVRSLPPARVEEVRARCWAIEDLDDVGRELVRPAVPA